MPIRPNIPAACASDRVTEDGRHQDLKHSMFSGPFGTRLAGICFSAGWIAASSADEKGGGTNDLFDTRRIADGAFDNHFDQLCKGKPFLRREHHSRNIQIHKSALRVSKLIWALKRPVQLPITSHASRLHCLE